MPRSRKKVLLIAGSTLVFAAWFLPSRFSAEGYRVRLQAGLEAVLHRPATFGSASFQLLPQPRFTLENVVIREDPAFGPEPFARIDRIKCDLRWSSIWHQNLNFARLSLTRPSFNIVRDRRQEWNLENFLVQSGMTGEDLTLSLESSRLPFEIEVEDARLNFKQGVRKKPFAIVDLRGRLNFDPTRDRIRFRLTGNPVRTDLPFPPPGLLELSGEWNPGSDLSGEFDATLRTRGASLYNWVPLLTGTNAEIYGVLDSDVRFRGSPQALRIEGESSMTQLHRWESLPPTDPMPIRLRYTAVYDANQGRLAIESAEAVFSGSNLHVTGTVEKIAETPEMDLVVALEHSRLQDWVHLAGRLWHAPRDLTLTGRLDGLLTIQGRAGDHRVGGFVTGRETKLVTSSGVYALSDLALRLNQSGARIDPLTLSIGPHSKIAIEGSVYRAKPPGRRGTGVQPLRYEIKMATKSSDLRDAIRFARALGISKAKIFDAQGSWTSTALLRGVAWPPAKPSVLVKADIRSARLLVPGLTEPVNIPRARLQWTTNRVLIDPFTAVMGSSIFTGRMEHRGAGTNPWQFDVKADSLSVEQGAAWFDSLGHRPTLALLEKVAGLGSITRRRSVASGLFTAINARGHFSTPLLTYRTLRLEDFEASLSLSDRILGLSAGSFHAGGGRGEACARVDINSSPAKINGELKLKDLKLATLANRLPPELRNSRGFLSGVTQFETRGLSGAEMSANLEAEGRAWVERIDFGDFDPLGAFVSQTRQSVVYRRHEASLRRAEIVFGIKDRQVKVANQQIEVDGAKLVLDGTWKFNGPLDLEVSADFRGAKRAWVSRGMGQPGMPLSTRIYLTGTLGEVHAQSEEAAVLTRRPALQ